MTITRNSTSSSQAGGSFTSDGRWFRDSEGRYCLFRGVNIGSRSKTCPYLPILPEDLSSGRTERALAQLRRLGYNFVRLVVPWKAFAEDAPQAELQSSSLGSRGQRTVDYLIEVIGVLYGTYRLYVLLDFHQDIAHGLYGGDGFPDWAIAVDSEHPRPACPPDPNPAWALLQYEILPPFGNLFSLAGSVRNTLRCFWNNRTPNEFGTINTQAQLVWTIERVAAALMFSAARPAIIGYEPFNEPAPVGLGKRCFEADYLTPFYQQVLNRIRKVDDQALLFLQPRVDWNMVPTPFGKEQDCPPPAHPDSVIDFQLPQSPPKPELNRTFLWDSAEVDDGLVFSFHFYDPWTIGWANFLIPAPDDMHNKQREWPAAFKVMVDAARSRNMVPFLTEFGASNSWNRWDSNLIPYQNQTQTYMDLVFQQIESNLLNGALWVYDLYYTAEALDGWNKENYSLLDSNQNIQQGMEEIVARPYPLRSAAEPLKLFFDSYTSQGGVVLGPVSTGGSGVVGTPTLIFVPKQIHYADGFDVYVTGGILVWDDANQSLTWHNKTDANVNGLVICKPNALDPAKLPPEIQAATLLRLSQRNSSLVISEHGL